MTMDRDTAALLARFEALGAGTDRDLAAAGAEAARAGSRYIWQAFVGEDSAVCQIRELSVPGPSGDIPARLYRPVATPPGDVRPLVVFLHGGGWALGDLEGYQPLMKALCVASEAAFLSVDYRLAPEHPFPAGLEDAFTATSWAMANASKLGIDERRVAVMGDSAGGNLAAVVAQRVARSGAIPIAAQFLIYPVLDVASPHERYPSRIRFGNGEFLLARADIDATRDWYLAGTGVDPTNPDVSPMFIEDLSSSPPTVMVSAGFDPLRDENHCYAGRLERAGVRTSRRCFDTTIHAFLSLGVLPVAAQGRRWLAAQVARFLR